MELISTDFLGKPLRLEATMSGWHRLFWNGYLVSERAASAESEGHIEHQFNLQTDDGLLACRVAMDLQWQPFSLQYTLSVNDQLISDGSCSAEEIQKQTPKMIIPEKKSFSYIGMASLALKLLKSAKAIKVALAGASVAAYSWLFSLPFALCLIACLVFHEYGHLKAMKYFGMKTKGIFLIPFMGGLALGDDKINTRWQDVVISIMGPTFGLVLSIFFLLLYWITGEIFFAGIASFNALINSVQFITGLAAGWRAYPEKHQFFDEFKNRCGLVCAGSSFGCLYQYAFWLVVIGFYAGHWRIGYYVRVAIAQGKPVVAAG
jgi:Zn-dependent protease